MMCFSNVLKCSIFRTGCTIEINYKDIFLNLDGACVSFRHPGYDDPGGENRRATLVIISFIWRPTSTCQRNAVVEILYINWSILRASVLIETSSFFSYGD